MKYVVQMGDDVTIDYAGELGNSISASKELMLFASRRQEIIMILVNYFTTTELAAVALCILQELANQVDHVMAEFNMSEMDCFEFLERIQLIKDCTLIVTSSTENRDLVKKALAKGVCFFLRKPISSENLKNVWQHVYASSKRALERMNVPNLTKHQVAHCLQRDDSVGPSNGHKKENFNYCIKKFLSAIASTSPGVENSETSIGCEKLSNNIARNLCSFHAQNNGGTRIFNNRSNASPDDVAPKTDGRVTSRKNNGGTRKFPCFSRFVPISQDTHGVTPRKKITKGPNSSDDSPKVGKFTTRLTKVNQKLDPKPELAPSSYLSNKKQSQSRDENEAKSSQQKERRGIRSSTDWKSRKQGSALFSTGAMFLRTD
ncbi:unnamed protein product [Fraxinus pennsylvanica]|uniref:Response regulatory domain-containing protein n=1 Tax=Fraxinus pennsylvanica TaxID=56036 RepID=A0AAD2DL26_9LAMI|nr:unnamed protein product [Fraxinus pennsylvanica]